MVERSILERYFNNTCSPEEREKVLAWLAEDQHREEVEDLLSTLWGNYDNEQWVNAERREPSYAQIRAAMPELATAAQELPRRLAKPKREAWWYVAAACVGFAITIGGLLWSDREVADANGYITVQTEKGERKRVTLSDGSEIYLNADSRLVYPKEMAMQKAAIYIEGEAFFNMTESDKPRVIKAGGVETTATAGSSKFNISAFPADSVITVAVDDGKAEVRSDYGPLLKLRIPEQVPDSSVLPLTKLKPPKTMPLVKLRPAVKMRKREFLVVNKQGGEVDLSSSLNEKKVFGWKDGILYFDRADADEIASTLERWYGVKISFCEDGRPSATYTAEFDNANLPSVLSQWSASLQLNYKQDGNEVFICNK